LIDRANGIRNIRVPITTIADFYEARLTEFRAILDQAKDQKIPLRGKDLVGVLTALASAIENLGVSDGQGFELLLGTLEELGSTYCAVTRADPQDRKREQLQLDGARHQILHTLCLLGRVGGTTVNDAEKGESFDRLYGILQSIQSPEVKNDAVKDMTLAEWYLWSPQVVGAERYDKLLRFVEDNQTCLSDSSKVRAIVTLTARLARHKDVEDSDIAGDFGRLCAIASSIVGDEAKGTACIYLIERRDWLPVDTRDGASGLLSGIVTTIADNATRARVAAVEPVPQSR
jgi:hypothetical protein